MDFAKLPRPFFVLAPMDDVTDMIFRQMIGRCAPPDVYFTEFVNADGLQSPGRAHLLKKLRFGAIDQPLIAQIWGKVPENFYKTAQQIADGTLAQEAGAPSGANYVGIDLNMGCPAKTVVKNGACSALIDNRELAVEIIRATQAGAAEQLPVSVKTRLGSRTIDLAWPELLLKQKLNMLTIHGRTRRELSDVPAHWDEIGKVRELRDRLAPDTLIVGNGDVANRAEGIRLAHRYGLDGIMIGRGVFHDPFAFAADSPWADYDPAERVQLYAQHVKDFSEAWPRGERQIATLNKFCKVYIQGFDGAKELRERLMTATNADQLLGELQRATHDLQAAAFVRQIDSV